MSDSLRIIIRNSYISRLWTWIVNYGILLVATALLLTYEHFGILGPLRLSVNRLTFEITTHVFYAVSVLSIAVSMGLRLPNTERKLADHADSVNLAAYIVKAGLNPALNAAEQRAVFILLRLAKLENYQWTIASIPAFSGLILYIMGGSSFSLLLYIAISMVAIFFLRPSLEDTEELLESYLRRRTPPFSEQK